MSSFFFGASESYSQPAGSADQNCEFVQECQCYQFDSEPCEVLTPELDIPSSIPISEEMQQNTFDYSKMAQNISNYDTIPTQNQRVLRSASSKRNDDTPKKQEKPRNRSAFPSRKPQSRRSSNSRSRTRKSSVSRRDRC